MQQWYLPLSWKDSALVFLPLLLEPEEQIRQPLAAEEVGGYTSKQKKGMKTAGCCPRACQIVQICIQTRTTMHKTQIQSLCMQQYLLWLHYPKMDRMQIFYILLGSLTFFTGSFSVANNNVLSKTTWCSIKWKNKMKKKKSFQRCPWVYCFHRGLLIYIFRMLEVKFKQVKQNGFTR